MSTEVKQEGEFKIKKRTPKKLTGSEDVIKVDFSKPAVEPKKEKTKDAVQEPSTKEVDVHESSGDGKEVGKGNTKEQPSAEKTEEKVTEESPIQIIEDEEDNSEEAGVAGSDEAAVAASEQKEVLQEAKAQELPEGVDKLIKFMEETGGNVQDYARLNADYSNVDSDTLLREYYKQNKPHLDAEDVDLLLEDFTWDEEIDEEKDIRKKKIAYKEEVAKAKNFLEQTKSKYYEEIKLRPGVTQEQQKAMDFFNRYTEEQKRNEAIREGFINTTKNYFSDDFKGFDFKLGNKKVRYGIKDPNSIAESQKDLTDFVGTFLDKNGQMKDPAGYHKAIYAARNADTMATHFYEQGRADAIKEQVAKTKNITTEPRQTAPGNVFVNGLKVKAISGLDSSKLKIRTKKFNN
jgi:antitoxin component HigA of HigAB toxin-antitoxin module